MTSGSAGETQGTRCPDMIVDWMQAEGSATGDVQYSHGSRPDQPASAPPPGATCSRVKANRREVTGFLSKGSSTPEQSCFELPPGQCPPPGHL
jgi:hypothetical protein